ncbi:MAG: hypothetical protein GY772_01655 [bacterium]|nr:hypothetical protein [bacterium]
MHGESLQEKQGSGRVVARNGPRWTASSNPAGFGARGDALRTPLDCEQQSGGRIGN